MSIITPQQALSYANAAGFTGVSKYVIAAIAEAESGLNTQAVNLNDPYGGSYGILQINGAHFIPTSSKSQSNVTTKSCALDPQCAFNYAFKLSNGGTDFSAWSTFTSGAYKKYVLPSTITTDGGGSNYPATCPPFDLACAASSFFSSNQVRQIGLLFAGLILLLIGIEILFFGKGKEEKQ